MKTEKWIKAANNYFIVYLISILLNLILCFLITNIKSEYILEPLSTLFIVNFVIFFATIHYVTIILFFGGMITYAVEHKQLQNKKCIGLKLIRLIIFPLIEYTLRMVSFRNMDQVLQLISQIRNY